MRKKKVTKKECQKKHFATRLLERYNLYYSREMHDELVKKIQNNEATFVVRQSNRVSVFDVEYNKVILRLVYDNKRKTFSTVLPS